MPRGLGHIVGKPHRVGLGPRRVVLGPSRVDLGPTWVVFLAEFRGIWGIWAVGALTACKRHGRGTFARLHGVAAAWVSS